MKTNNVIRVKIIYSIIMAVLTTVCLLTIILCWYKADKSARYALFIPIIGGYFASIWVYIHRRPFDPREYWEHHLHDDEGDNYRDC